MQSTNSSTYYDVPMLKRPLWRWEIACYFFLEGISSGAYLLGALASLLDAEKNEQLVRVARYVSAAAFAPCPPLLIADLGRPERFAHMLRVFKPTSPMNFGSWSLTAYSAPLALLAGKQMLEDDVGTILLAPAKPILRLLPERAAEVAGLAPALAMIAYPGVLLSTTSIPVWCRTRMLGAVFACSSFSAAAAAITFVLHLRNSDERLFRKMRRIELLAAGAEAAALAGYIATSGSGSKPLTSGKYAKHLWLGAVVAGMVLPALFGSAKSRKRNLLSATLTLAGSLALKWAVVHAGRDSAEDPIAAHEAATPNESATGWPAPEAVPQSLQRRAA